MYKVCFVTTISLTLKSFVVDFAKYMYETGEFEIHFVCDPDSDSEKKLPEYIHFDPIPMKRGLSADGLKVILAMYRYFKREKFDLVQYSTPNASCYASIAAKMAGVPCRLYCQWGIAYVGFRGLKRRVFKTIEKTVCRLSTRIEPDSKSNLEFAYNEGLYPKDKGTVIWNGSACGINLKKFDIEKKEEYRKRIRECFSIPSDAFVFGFVGRITRDKGINELLSAYKKILDESPDAYMIFVGHDETDDTIDRDLYDWAKGEKNAIFAGYTDVVEQMLSAMDCYVLPSYREGFGMGTIEAQAMGVPVIVTDIPGPKDAMIPGVTGLSVEKRDADGLYAAMRQMLTDTKDYGEKGVLFVKQNFEQRELFKYILQDRKSLLEIE